MSFIELVETFAMPSDRPSTVTLSEGINYGFGLLGYAAGVTIFGGWSDLLRGSGPERPRRRDWLRYRRPATHSRRDRGLLSVGLSLVLCRQFQSGEGDAAL